MKITLVAGARPNFIKIAPVIQAIQKSIIRGTKLKYRLIHTGQHYDKNMSDIFFTQLGIPSPDSNLNSTLYLSELYASEILFLAL